MQIKYQTPKLIIILCSLIYETFLILSITFIALIISSIISFLIQNYPLNIKKLITSIIIIISWYLYFIINWQKGQTLAMKTWNIHLQDNNNNTPSKKKLCLRFIWSIIFIIFIPLIIYFVYKNQGFSPKISFCLALIWLILPWGWAIFNKQRKFIYDQLAGTKLVHKKYTN